MTHYIIKYGQVYIQLPDDNLESFDLVLAVIRFFKNRLLETRTNQE